jgi:molybdopterin converting factor small subunit
MYLKAKIINKRERCELGIQLEMGKIEVFDVLPQVFIELNKNKDQQREIEEILVTRNNFPRGLFSELLVDSSKIEQLPPLEIKTILLVAYEITKDERIQPLNFYTDKEIKQGLKFKYQLEEEVSFPYTIENVLRSSKTDFVTVMSYKELVDWLRAGLITYNYDCQRLPIEKSNKKGKVSIKPKTVLRSVRAIVDKMKKEEFATDTIILNILANGKDRINYENGDLTIYEGTEVDIIDGWHRLKAMEAVIEENPDFEGYMNVNIKNYTLKRAQEALGQFNTVNPFDKVLSRHYSEKGHERNIAKRLQENSALKGKITIRVRVDKKLGQLTNMDVLSKSINQIFNIENDLEEEKVYEHLKKFFGILINSYPKEFQKDMVHTLKDSWINHHNSFVGHVCIAYALYQKYGKEFPIDEVSRIVDAINWKKDDSSDYHAIMKEQGNKNSNQIKVLIRKYFEEKLKTVL